MNFYLLDCLLTLRLLSHTMRLECDIYHKLISIASKGCCEEHLRVPLLYL